MQQLPAAVQEGRRSSEEVRQEEVFEPIQIRAPPRVRKKIKKGLDERLQLSNEFLMNYRLYNYNNIAILESKIICFCLRSNLCERTTLRGSTCVRAVFRTLFREFFLGELIRK